MSVGMLLSDDGLDERGVWVTTTVNIRATRLHLERDDPVLQLNACFVGLDEQRSIWSVRVGAGPVVTSR